MIIFKKQIYEIKLGVPPKNQFSMDKYDMNTTSLGERIGGAGDLENKANSACFGKTMLGKMRFCYEIN